MKRIKCKYCGAKPREEFAVKYAGHTMCAECHIEYQAILEGKLSKGEEERSLHEYIGVEGNIQRDYQFNKITNPLFRAFEKGWKKAEDDHGLQKLEIPAHIQRFYQVLWLSERLRWESITEEKLKADNEQREAYYKRILTDRENKNGISEDP